MALSLDLALEQGEEWAVRGLVSSSIALLGYADYFVRHSRILKTGLFISLMISMSIYL